MDSSKNLNNSPNEVSDVANSTLSGSLTNKNSSRNTNDNNTNDNNTNDNNTNDNNTNDNNTNDNNTNDNNTNDNNTNDNGNNDSIKNVANTSSNNSNGGQDNDNTLLSNLVSILTINEGDVSADARVVMYPPPSGLSGIELKDKFLDNLSLPTKGLNVAVARQSPQATNFLLNLNLGHKCRFFYDVASDNLIVQNLSNKALYLMAIDTSADDANFAQSASLEENAFRPISPGCWCICEANDGEPGLPLTELLLFRRRFCVTMLNMVAVGSRRPTSSAEDDETGILVPDMSAALEPVSGENPMLHVRPATMLTVTSLAAKDSFTVTNLRDIANQKLGMVFRGQHSTHGDSAVKVVKYYKKQPETEDVLILVDMWNQEAGFLAKLQHDSIVKFYGSDSRFYTIFLEYLPYPDLSTMRDANNMFSGTIQDARRVLRDISSALTHLVSQIILHNDIKPGNIIYDVDRGAVLIDFGLASQGLSNHGGGTSHYVPLDAAVSGLRNSKSDVYSLGVTMLYLLKKTPLPELVMNTWDIYDTACQLAIDWQAYLEDIIEGLDTDGIEGIVLRMLDNDPGSRIEASAINELLEASFNS